MVRTGTVLNGRYEIVRLIAEGGMGAVYEGRDLKFGGGPVAIKRCLMTGEAMQRAFVREAELLANLSHPGVAKARDLFAGTDGQYLVMEFIPGSDLEQILSDRGTPVSIKVALEWMDQALDALSYMHGLRPPIVHRDIKPSNLKLTPSGHVILIDFGLAKGTGTTSVAGYSANYAPLEQLQNEGTDARSDLYALGATLYRLLTGRAPESALDRVKQIAKYRRDPLLSVNMINALVPETVAQVVWDAMALEPEDRLQSANEMRRRLREAGDSLASSYQWASAPTEGDHVFEKSSKTRSFIADGRTTVPFTERLSRPTTGPNGSIAVRSAPTTQIDVEAVISAPTTQIDVERGKTDPKYTVGKYILASGCLVMLLFMGVAGNSYRNWRVERARVEQQEAERRAELSRKQELLNVADQQRVEQPQQTEPQNSANQEALNQKQMEEKASMETARRRREAKAREAERQRQAATAREADRLRQEIVAREAERQKQEAAARELEKQKREAATRELEKQKAAWEAERQKQEAATRELEKQKAAWEADRQKAAREAEKQRATWDADRQKAAREAEKQRKEDAVRAAEFAKQKEKADAVARKTEKEKEAKEVKKQKKREEEKKKVGTGVRVGVSILGGIFGPRRNKP
jgi:serine/threonine protein kinase